MFFPDFSNFGIRDGMFLARLPFPQSSHFDGNGCKSSTEASLLPLKVPFCGPTMVSRFMDMFVTVKLHVYESVS